MAKVPIRIIPIVDYGTLFHPNAGKYSTFWSALENSPNFRIESDFEKDRIASMNQQELQRSVFIVGMPRNAIDEKFAITVGEIVKAGASLLIVCGGGHQTSLDATGSLLHHFGIKVRKKNMESRSYLGRNRNVLIFEHGSIQVTKSGKNAKFILRLVHEIEYGNPDWCFPDNNSAYMMMTTKNGEGSIGVISTDYIFSNDPETGIRARSNIHLVGALLENLVGEQRLLSETSITIPKKDMKKRKTTVGKPTIKVTPKRKLTATKGYSKAIMKIFEKNKNTEAKRIWEGKVYTIAVEGGVPEEIEVKPGGLFQFLSTWQNSTKTVFTIDFKIDPALVHEISQSNFPTRLVAIEISMKSENSIRVQVRAYRRARHFLWRILIIFSTIIVTVAGMILL